MTDGISVYADSSSDDHTVTTICNSQSFPPVNDWDHSLLDVRALSDLC